MGRTPIHPGVILADELEEIGLAARQFAEVLLVPPNRIHQSIGQKLSLTADTVLRLARYFGMSPDFWMNPQSTCELDLPRYTAGEDIADIHVRKTVGPSAPAA